MVGRLRLWSGYVLFFYVVTHLLNHTLGLISLRVIEAGRHWFVLIWHNPRCSKSRGTLELLKKKGVTPQIREYLKAPPSKAEVEKLLDMVGGEPTALIRDGEAEFKALKKKKADLSRADIVKAIAAHPVLLQRPIVVAGKRAAIGRPPEAVLPLLK